MDKLNFIFPKDICPTCPCQDFELNSETYFANGQQRRGNWFLICRNNEICDQIERYYKTILGGDKNV